MVPSESISAVSGVLNVGTFYSFFMREGQENK